MTVRTAALGLYLVPPSSNQSIAQCPDGYTLLVKSIHLDNQGGADNPIEVRLYGPPGGPTVRLVFQTLTPNQLITLTTWIAIPPGGFLYVINNTSPLAVWVSGAVLYGTAQGYTQPPQATRLPGNPFPLPTG